MFSERSERINRQNRVYLRGDVAQWVASASIGARRDAQDLFHEEAKMERDRLILLEVGFEDPAYPGQNFYCWHCMLMEGILAAFPDLQRKIDIERIAWSKPRKEVADRIGVANQSLPVMILGNDAPAGLETGEWNGCRFVSGKDAILQALAFRHGIPKPHP